VSTSLINGLWSLNKVKMFTNNASGKMQRTTSPPSFDVYRSLPISASLLARNASSSSTAETVPASIKESLIAAERKSVAEKAPASASSAIPFPPVPIASLAHPMSVWLDEFDLEVTRAKLAAVCSTCELRKTASTCEYVCSAQLEDGNENCRFTLNVWRVPEGEEGALGKYLIQVDRNAGCPYLFRQVLAKAFDAPEILKSTGKKLFRALPLPECLCDEGAGIRRECVESAISLATSDLYEQRVQGVLTLASLCSEKNPTFSSLFTAANGPQRIGKLQGESDCVIKRAVARILCHCA